MKTKILAMLAFVAATMASCSEEWKPAIDGSVSFASMGIEVSSAMDVVNSRAEYDLSSFLIKVYNNQNQVVNQWTYATMPEIFSLEPGDYRVEVQSHEVQKAEWSRPYFLGSKNFTIEANKVTEIGVVSCKFASLKVSVVFTDALRAQMADDVKVEISANDEGKLIFTPAETRSGFFAVLDGSTTLTAVFTGTVKGYRENIIKTYTDIAAGQHRIITFDLKDNPTTPPEETGNINPGEGINVDVSVTDSAISGGVDVSEDNETGSRPGDEDFNEPGTDPDPGPGTDPEPGEETITFEAAQLSFDTPNIPVDGMNGVIDIYATDGVAHLIVNIASNNAEFFGIINDDFGIATFDLAYPGDKEPALAGLGLATGSAVIDQTHVPFDITQFIPLLKGYRGTHNFTITVTDSKNHQVAKTLTFVVE